MGARSKLVFMREGQAQRWVFGMGIPLLVAVLASLGGWFGVRHVDPLNSLEASIVVRLSQAIAQPAHPDIVIVEVRDETLLGTPARPDGYLPRARHAQLIRELEEAGVKTLVYDLYFGPDAVAEFAPEVVEVLRADTKRLKEALASLRQMAVVLGSKLADPDDATPSDQPTRFLSPTHLLDGPNPLVSFGAMDMVHVDSKLLGACALRHDLTLGRPLPHLSIAAAAQHMRLPLETASISEDRTLLRIGMGEWEVTADRDILLHWTEADQPFPNFELGEVLEWSDVDRAARLGGKLVIVGDVREGQDIKLSPRGSVPGVYTMAQQINTTLIPESKRVAYAPDTWSAIWTFGLALCVSFGLLRGSWIIGGLVALAAVLLAFNVPILTVHQGRVLMESVSPFGAAVLAFLLGAVAHTAVARSVHAVRRGSQACVLFVDVTKSTEAVRRMGAEAYAARFESLIRRLHADTARLGGRLERTTGDGALIVFHGAEVEEPSLLAVQMAQSIGNVEHEFDGLAVGLESGPISGRYVWEGDRRQWSSAGYTVNLAQRLCAYAGQEGLPFAIGPVAAGLLREAVNLKVYGVAKLKGFEDVEVTVYTVTGEAP